MSRCAVFVRLAFLLGLLVCLSQAAAPNAAGLILPGLNQRHSADRVCRSIKICHNSRGAAWTTVQVFSALEPLLSKLRLEPATEFVDVKPLQGCLSSGCCCSTPVELRFSLPVHIDKTAAALELAAVTEFLQFRLPRELQGTACTSDGLASCPPAKASQHKVIRPEDDSSLPPLPEGLIPYDGKRPAPEFEPATTPQPKPQAPKTWRDDPSKDPVLPEGLIPYDGKTTRQLLEEMDNSIEEAALATVPALQSLSAAAPVESGTPGAYGSSSSSSSGRSLLGAAVTPGTYGTSSSSSSSSGRALLETLDNGFDESSSVAAVPDMPAFGVSALSGDALLESGTPGAYGSSSSGRSLLQFAGGYGGRALLESVGGYGSPAGRALLEQQPPKPADKSADKPKQQGGEDKKKQEAKKQEPKKQEPKKQDTDKKKAAPPSPPKSPKSTPKKPSDSSSSSPAPCMSVTNSTMAPSGRPYGTCYCRYNPKDSTWALEQAACRAALFSRCKTAGTLLECSQVEAFYKGLSMPGSEAPHKDALTAFLYTDCPPAPPCSCSALVTGKETPLERARCCTDLQAHCQVPFSGLDCEDVGRFCRPYGRQSSDPLGALISFVLVKTHGFDCSSPTYATSYASVVVASGRPTVDVDSAIRQLSKAAMFSGVTQIDYDEADRVAALVTMLVGGCVAVAVAVVSVAVMFKLVSARPQHTTPLLERL